MRLRFCYALPATDAYVQLLPFDPFLPEAWRSRRPFEIALVEPGEELPLREEVWAVLLLVPVDTDLYLPPQAR